MTYKAGKCMRLGRMVERVNRAQQEMCIAVCRAARRDAAHDDLRIFKSSQPGDLDNAPRFVRKRQANSRTNRDNSKVTFWRPDGACSHGKGFYNHREIMETSNYWNEGGFVVETSQANDTPKSKSLVVFVPATGKRTKSPNVRGDKRKFPFNKVAARQICCG